MAYEKKDGTKEPAKDGKKEETDKEILEYARTGLKEIIDEEETERKKMEDDLRFCTLDQWPDDIRRERENDVESGPRPCLTIDKINQYIVQVVNDMRQGKPGINVRPQDDFADPKTAEVLKGIIRNIEDQSKADIAYATAGESAAKIGLGYFRITTEYVSDDSFDQEIVVKSIPNTFSVFLGKHTMPDGSDAERGFIVEAMPIAKFKEKYPKAKCADKDFDGIDKDVVGYWKTGETITVVEEFCIKRERQVLLFLADGTTITQEDYNAWPEDVAGAKPTIQDERVTEKKQLKWRKLTAVEVLEKRDLPGQYIPIVEVVGREAWVNGKRILWGLVRPAKDSLRMYNYWASTITERMALAPKAPFIAAKGQLAGMEEKWKKANRVNYSYLEYDPVSTDSGNALPPPQRVGATPLEAALIQQMQVIEHDVQTSLGMFKAAIGESESQQSGRAILALQRESDTSTYHFGANLGLSIRHAGRIIVEWIPHYYDTKRIVRIMGEDGEVKTAMIDPEQDVAHREITTQEGIASIYNPGVGKYDVSTATGPSYNTKRMEAAATFVELAKGAADPGSAAVLRYLTVLNSDFYGADKAAKMLKALLPPQVAEDEPIPPKAMAEIAKLQQTVQGMQEAGAKLEQENVQLKAGVAEAQIKAQTEERIEGQRLQAEARIEQMRLLMEERDAAMQRRLAEQEARREADFERWKALLEARTDVVVARINAENKPEPARPQ